MTDPTPWFVDLLLWLSEPVRDNWIRVEVLWTALSLVALAPTTFKLALVGGDLWAAAHARENRYRRVLAATWTVANPLFFEAAAAGFVFVGWVAGQVPSAPLAVEGNRIPAGAISGLVFVGLDVLMVAVIALTLWIRVRLGARDKSETGR